MKKYSFLPDLCILWPITRALYILCSLSRSISLSLCLLQCPSDFNWHITFCPYTSWSLQIVNLSHSCVHPHNLIPHEAGDAKPSDWSIVFTQYTLAVWVLVLVLLYFQNICWLLRKKMELSLQHFFPRWVLLGIPPAFWSFLASPVLSFLILSPT